MDLDYSTSSDSFDRAYYLVGKYFPKESVEFGYQSISGHKIFVRSEEISDEDRIVFKLKTGILLQEDNDIPRWVGGAEDGNGKLPIKQWLTYDEVKFYLRIQEESKLVL